MDLLTSEFDVLSHPDSTWLFNLCIVSLVLAHQPPIHRILVTDPRRAGKVAGTCVQAHQVIASAEILRVICGIDVASLLHHVAKEPLQAVLVHRIDVCQFDLGDAKDLTKAFGRDHAAQMLTSHDSKEQNSRPIGHGTV